MTSTEKTPLVSDRDENGVPLHSDYDRICPAPKSLYVLYTAFSLILCSIGVLVGAGIWFLAKPKLVYEKVELLAHYQLGPLYLSLFVLKQAMQMISANMGTARRACRINLPDQHVYRVFGGPANGSVVLMDVEGDFGEFNRAQRALANLEEYLPLFLAEAAFVGVVLPWLTAALVLVFSMARLVGARGYTDSKDGRMSGNTVSMVAFGMLDGLSLFIGVSAIILAK